MSDIESRLARVRERIATAARRFGRPPEDVHLLAVSKRQPVAAIAAAVRAGQTAFGENYLQEALEKVDALAGSGIQWHFIGALQSNKTKAAAEYFDWIHTIDRLKIARRLSDQRPAERGPLNCCLQVNVSGEGSKSGVAPEEVPALAKAISKLDNLRLRGLMAIPAPAPDFDAQRMPLRRLRELMTSLKAQGLEMDTLSMGMSADLEAAVAEGATILRIGTAVFGERPGG
ncbi:MAG TPA: YggS family pyridoxal phosphate-dependent enzyme [Gammaproteobacteria bacterium]|nr:YggS family pyridoxal phosphate-dependent enzyme [Gammaproteobacteria bacterium]